jgi:hypothetical protein
MFPFAVAVTCQLPVPAVSLFVEVRWVHQLLCTVTSMLFATG